MAKYPKQLPGPELEKRLQALVDRGLKFGHCSNAFRAMSPAEKAYVDAAQEYQRDGELEVDGEAVVSMGADNGAYVMAWRWVADKDIWDGPTDSDGEPCRFINKYKCDDGHDLVEWEDQWSCACDDECPECGSPIEASSSIELDITGKPITEDA